MWLEVETDFTRNFRSTSPVVSSYALVESRLGGAGVWDVLVPAPTKIDPKSDTKKEDEKQFKAFLKRIRNLQRRLRTEVTLTGPAGEPEPGVTKVLSLVDALDAIEKLPFISFFGLESRMRRLDVMMPGLVPSLLSTNPETGQHYYRIMLRSRERQPAAQKKQLIADVARICHEEFPDAEVTGFFVILTNLIDSINRDQWVTFGVAVGAIAA
jgi:predicted RND superfamily exporter protein